MQVAVIGGGLQGCCLAMELAGAGVQVDLYDRAPDLLMGASSCNEGKLHLGYVYANDPSLASARLMARGATMFASLMRRWIGEGVDVMIGSAPFHYVVPRGSLLPADEIERHLHACHRIACDLTSGAPDYFGEDYRESPRRLRKHPSYDPTHVAAVFRTSEVAIDPEAMATLIRERIASEPNIQSILGATVERVSSLGSGLTLCFSKAGASFHESYAHVINASWDGRLAIDAALGIVPSQPWLFRFKHFARIRSSSPHHLPSTTIVLGPYGDIVDYRNGDYYLSWYPATLTGRSSELTPPAWTADLSQCEASDMLRAILSGLAQFVPGIADVSFEEFQPDNIKGGVIFAWGKTDIDDRRSELHQRANIGPQHYGRYHSVDTGKLTTAPLFAKMTADRILSC